MAVDKPQEIETDPTVWRLIGQSNLCRMRLLNLFRLLSIEITRLFPTIAGTSRDFSALYFCIFFICESLNLLAHPISFVKNS